MKQLFDRLEDLESKEEERKKYDDIKDQIELAYRKEQEQQ